MLAPITPCNVNNFGVVSHADDLSRAIGYTFTTLNTSLLVYPKINHCRPLYFLNNFAADRIFLSISPRKYPGPNKTATIDYYQLEAKIFLSQ
jgi:hypothetical protein